MPDSNDFEKFKGRVLESDYAYLNQPREFDGQHLLVKAADADDVKLAIKRAAEFKVPVRVRSGLQTAEGDSQDITEEDDKEASTGGIPEDITGSVVIDVTGLDSMHLGGEQLTVGAGATAGQLAAFLSDNGRVLPLNDSADKSIVSDVLKNEPSLLVRNLGRIADYVAQVNGVDAAGDDDSFSVAEQPERWRKLQDKEEQFYITSLVLNTEPVEPLWMLRATLHHPGAEPYIEVAEQLIIDSGLTSSIDWSLRSHYGPIDPSPLATIMAAGRDPNDQSRAEELIAGYLLSMTEPSKNIDVQRFVGSDVYPAILEFGQRASRDSEVTSTRQQEVIDSTRKSGAVLVGYDEYLFDSADDYDQTHLDVRLQIADNNKITIHGFDYQLARFRAERSGTEKDWDPTIEEEALRRLYEAFPPTIGHPTLENFRGQVFQLTGSWYYDKWYHYKTAQYATEYRQEGHAKPWMLCEPNPKYEDDIAKVIKLAKDESKNLVVRSGGHQYSGLSSGGSETIVLPMDRFTKFKVRENPDDPARPLVFAGAGMHVNTFNKKLKKRSLAIPGGQCPYVAIGGHVQTGGYGHLTRSLGLLLDYVRSFRIMLANGTVKTVNRPSSETADDQLNDDLFWGVMGGNPGSFGVLLDYCFEAIPDDDEPQAIYYEGVRVFDKELARTMLTHMQAWSDGVARKTLPHGRDFTLTMASSGQRLWAPVINSKISVVAKDENSTRHSNPNQEPEFATASMRWNDDYCPYNSRICGARIRENIPLSSLAERFVNRWPEISGDGREFNLAFSKRLNCSYQVLTTGFINGFVQLMDDVVQRGYRSNVNVVSQFGVLGGEFINEDAMQRCALQHRRAVIGFTFDVFHDEDDASVQQAAEIQSDMQDLVDEHFSNGQEARLLWGTFGNVALIAPDADNPEGPWQPITPEPPERKMYYPIQNDYDRLRKLKSLVDRDGVFQTPFTIPPLSR